MAEWLITGGRIVDETGERTGDVRVVDGVIAEVGRGLAPGAGATVLDAEGCVVAPGLVDLQVHFREPGREDAETVESGARAAALGGCTAVVCMPNTDPPLDDAAVVAGGARTRPAGRVRRARRRVHHQGPRAAWSSRRSASCTTSACASSPTTATASPTRR